jgi:uncharacterized damage-inducible protein DinB
VEEEDQMNSAELLADAFGRIRDGVHDAVDGLTTEDLAARLDGEANSIAWLVWHLTRIQDDHVAGVAGVDQVWTAAGWVQRFALPFDTKDHGYGHSSSDVAAVVVDAPLLHGYHDAVYEATMRFLATLSDVDLDRVVDEGWDPPVTMGVRLVSVITDDLMHTGQANYVRGILERR